ncbi:hypothetical protein O3M35_012587 [Rhynocoris fuscipes]|uniref:Gustatory receptor n=1 Tax=Rhynocoris fuscipes TaxID=488301 RepID=A0AAW1CW25_9HEMI
MSNILRTLNSIFRFSRIGGLFPFIIKKDGSIELSIILLIIAFINQIILITFVILIFLSRWVFVYYDINVMHESLLAVGQLAVQCAQITHLISLVKHRKQLSDTFRQLKQMESDDEPINTNACFWYPTICSFILIGMPIVEAANTVYEFIDIVAFILIIMKWELAYLGIFQFTGLLSICRHCFKALNNKLNNSLSRYSKLEAMEKSERLISCCETINRCYGPMLLIMLVSFFGLITTNLYAAYLQWTMKPLVVICVLNAIILFNTFRYLVKSCTTTANLANQFNRDLYRLLFDEIVLSCGSRYSQSNITTIETEDNLSEDNESDNSLPPALQKLIWQGSLAMEAINRKELEFTACGLFSINYGLMCSMIETSATYLMICIQFHDSMGIVTTRYEKTNYNNDNNDNNNENVNDTMPQNSTEEYEID